MAKFKTKMVEIEARQFNNDAASYEVLHWVNDGQNANDRGLARWHNSNLIIPTLEGDMRADIGDWIIKGLRGEFYPCKPDIFAMKYENAEAAPLLAKAGG